MGAIVRCREAGRISDRLPDELNIPIVHTLLEAYEEGDGLIDGVFMATPKDILEKLKTFLKSQPEGESEEELIADFLDQIGDQLCGSRRVIDACC